jgi:hypothetical protein
LRTSNNNFIYIYFFNVCIICPVHLIILEFITWTQLHEEYKLWSSSQRNYILTCYYECPIHKYSSWQLCVLYSEKKTRVSVPHETTGEIIQWNLLPITPRISDKSELGMLGSLAQDQSACTQRLGSWWPNRRQLASTAL